MTLVTAIFTDILHYEIHLIASAGKIFLSEYLTLSFSSIMDKIYINIMGYSNLWNEMLGKLHLIQII